MMGTAGALLLRQIIIDKNPSFEYTYNNAKLFSEIKGRYASASLHFNEKNLLESTDCYTNNDILSSDPKVSETAMNQKDMVAMIKANQRGSIKYEYNGNDQLAKMTYTTTSGSESSDFSYDASGRINKQNLYWDNAKIGYIEYNYDSDGNVAEENLYNITSSGGQELSSTTTYEYDGKQNPYRLVSSPLIPGIATNINNITLETRTIHLTSAQGGDKVETIASTYTYNNKGYPTGKNGNVEYIYQ